ncbi:ATP-binding protein [Thiorhodovibrio frisius]|uniref:Putative transcriptional regulator with HTH domain n=1 Tax=Thiorhodovibrio frisius TaxID=631362 RepID=H8Z7D0_9GAMM|nr:ATP-binding protein [Thiorhodovibrio frisius]EIC19846.1 putative transcriptional regulator with HTH domain [Thiorhodovibrio frisius]WPL20574.1 Divergent AAA domain protein [Thiorhodovibrio frisius]
MIYDDKAELLDEIAAGEDALLELKLVVFKGDQVRFASEPGRAPKVIAEVFVSMANTEGGLVVFGVDDHGAIIGIDAEKRDKLEQFVVQCALDHCVPPIEPALDWVMLPGADGGNRLCLKVAVPRARFYVHQTSDGRFLKRVGSHRTPIPAEQLGRLLASRQLMLPFEERPVHRADLNAIDRTRFETYYRRRFGHPIAVSELSYEHLLRNLKLAVQDDDGLWRPTMVGVLLFSERPDRYLSGAYVDLAVYDHAVADGNTRDAKRVTGPVVEQIEWVLTYLRTSPLVSTLSVKDGMGRTDKPAYSDFALQEAVVNALAHRDYEIAGAQVIVTLFPDRIEIRNPGGLHNTLTEENLYAGCQPVRRNQILAGFLRDYESPATGRRYMETRGEGFLTLVRASTELSGRRPELVNMGGAVKLTLFAAHLEEHRSVVVID